MTEFLFAIMNGLVKVVAHPLFYVSMLLVFLQYRRQNGMERRMFGVRCTSLTEQFLRSITYGIGGGLLVTTLLTGVGAVLSPVDLTYVWVVALLLALVNARYICFAYSGGLLSLIALVLNLLPALSGSNLFVTIYNDLRNLHIADLMTLVAVLHLVESLLIRWNGADDPLPVFVEGKRGQLIGGFILQKFWVIPMATFVATGAGASVATPSWWPLISLGAGAAGLQVVPMPAVLGYSGVAITNTPKKKAEQNAKYLMWYSLILLLLSIVGSYWHPLLWITALFCTVVHELLILWEINVEQTGHPMYVRPLQGLKILTVLPKSPAEGMGLRSGETILRVNGTPVNTPYDLHFAINQNPAYAKFELLTPEGEPRFASTPIYMGDHHQLGIILVPDDQARQYVRLDSISPGRWLWGRLVGGGKQAPSTYH